LTASNKLGDRWIAVTQVACILATGWFVWINAVLPRLGLRSLASIAAEALLYVLLAWICGAVIAFWVYFAISLADLPRSTRFSLRSSEPAMWFAPAIVLLSTHLSAAMMVSLVLTANATRLLISQWGAVDLPLRSWQPASIEPAPLFRAASAEHPWNLTHVFAGSFAAQAGLVSMLWGHAFSAAALFALSTAILTSLSISTGAYRPGKPPALPHSALSIVLTFLLAVTLTFGGIAFRGRGGAGPGSASDSSEAAGEAGKSPVTQGSAPPDSYMGPADGFPGVILLPALKPHTTLIVPMPLSPAQVGAMLSVPKGIPFSGQYWMYRWPAKRPPPGAAIRRGSASDFSFHTTDGWPMDMEAHQILDQPVDMHCCTRIQLDIHNNDAYPGSVSIELILIDSAVANPGQTLGSVDAGPPSPSEQVLNFRMPSNLALPQFDELKVVFHRARFRADKSAKIAIDRFVLVP